MFCFHGSSDNMNAQQCNVGTLSSVLYVGTNLLEGLTYKYFMLSHPRRPQSLLQNFFCVLAADMIWLCHLFVVRSQMSILWCHSASLSVILPLSFDLARFHLTDTYSVVDCICFFSNGICTVDALEKLISWILTSHSDSVNPRIQNLFSKTNKKHDS